MASSFNLIRDSRVFFTTNVNNYGVVQSSGFSSGAYGAANTWEIQVQDGFSFSQNTTTETVTLSEAGDTPNRGQRNFNTALEAVDFTFSTYIRPRDAGSVIDAEEGVLWNAMFSAAPVGFTDLSGVALAGTTGTSGINGQLTCTATTLAVGGQVTIAGTNTATSSGTAGTAGVIANGTYYIIATNGTTTLTLGATATSLVGITSYTGPIAGLTFTYAAPGSVTGTSNWKNINAPYLANKLSTVTLDTGIGPGGTVYNIAITGGSLTFANNVNYLTPANLGVVNTPIVYFTGTRAISGTMNAYLRTGALQTAGLLKSLLEGSSTTVDPQFYMKLSIGGNPTATTRVDIEMPAVMLTIPTVATEQVVSTTISFTAQGSASSAFDIEQLNEVSLTYIAPQV